MSAARWTLIAVVLAAAACAVLPAGATGPGRDGKIAYSRFRMGSGPLREEIVVANADGTHPRRITSVPANYLDEQPDWSPDGQKIAFERCPDLDSNPDGVCRVMVVNANGSGLHQVGPGCTTPSACEWDLDPAWSPDGKTIAFTHEWGPVEGAPPKDEVQHSEIFLMAANGSNVRQLTRITTAVPFTGDVRAAAWSPDGKQLVFTVHNADAGNPPGGQALFVIGADGTGQRQLTPWSLHGGDHPDWSPGGSQILFVAVTGENKGDLDTIKPDGSGLNRLRRGRTAWLQSGSYSPDGKSILFSTSVGAVNGHCAYCPFPDVYVARADGSHVKPLSRTTNWEGSPDWGPKP
jgi:Tol biopolymer transport system component